MLRERLAGDIRFALSPAEPARREELIRIHDEDYVDRFISGQLPREVLRRIGLPWSPEFVWRTLASAGGTLQATQIALAEGFGGALAGGTHHAFRGEGSGFCVFNDLAIAIAWARTHGGIGRAAVVDLDVHQGDGTASIFEGDPNVYTMSLHGERNFPFRKQRSAKDVALTDGIGDEDYLNALESALPDVWRFQPELVLFQAGVDGLGSDRLGRLNLTMEGLARRDSMVLGEVKQRGIPLVITLGGGYSQPIELTVEAHVQTFRTAATVLLTGQTKFSASAESEPLTR